MAWRPMRFIKKWLIYQVNSFRFHICLQAKDRKPDNSGVRVKGNTHAKDEGGYYSVLQNIVQLQ